MLNGRLAANPVIVKTGEITNEYNNIFIKDRFRCSNQYKIFTDEDKDTICASSIPQLTKSIALIGDSHAQHVFYGLAESYPELNFLLIARSGLPLHNTKNFRSIIQEISQDPNISIVIISAYWYPKIKKFINKDEFTQSLYETLAILSAKQKKIYLITDTPNFSFNPSKCKFIRPMSHESQCSETSKYFNDQYSYTMKYISKAVQHFSTLKIIDVHKYFCSQNYCSMANGDTIFYRDRDHLNIAGSLYLSLIHI